MHLQLMKVEHVLLQGHVMFHLSVRRLERASQRGQLATFRRLAATSAVLVHICPTDALLVTVLACDRIIWAFVVVMSHLRDEKIPVAESAFLGTFRALLCHVFGQVNLG